MTLTQERLKELLDYDPGTGVFVWKKKPAPRANRIKAGDVAGCLGPYGYVLIGIDKKLYEASLLAWLYTHGYLPARIDHRDTDRANNRIGNLRECTRSQNQCNRGKPSNNTSGIKGVFWNSQCNKWHARIQLNYKRFHVGFFQKLEDAAEAVKEAYERLHNDYAFIG
jgi:hypothetical protein